MILSHATSDLLEALPGVLPGIRVAVLGPGDDEPGAGGTFDADRHASSEAGALAGVPFGAAELVERRLATGETIRIALPGASAAAAPFLDGLLDLLVQRDQLERDMESMNQSALQLLEQVAMLGETLPRLSAGASDEEIAATGLKACVLAAGVERALYLRLHQETALCEAQVFVENLEVEQVAVKPYPGGGDGFLAAGEGLLAHVLAAVDSVTFVQLQDEPTPGEIERLARQDLLAVPVTYGAGDKRVCLGALVLFDKLPTDGGGSRRRSLGSEEGQVALSFASMLGAVLGARQTAALGKELSMAQAIQAQILPDRPAVVPGFDLAGDYRTSGEVGGDYFDYVELADGRTFVVVADVSGHNLASGMMMVGARATLRTLAAVRNDPAQVFDDLAASMFEDLTRTERFITAAGVALRAGDGTVEIVNAGHNDLLLYRAATRTVQQLPSSSTILGFLPDASYHAERVRLADGDCLVLYTDGITEAMDQEASMFGEERLAEVVARAAERGGARDVVAAVLAAVRAFRGPYERGDDMTLVAIKALPQRRGAS